MEAHAPENFLSIMKVDCAFQVHSSVGLTLKPFFNFSKRPGFLTERKVVRGESFPKPPAIANEELRLPVACRPAALAETAGVLFVLAPPPMASTRQHKTQRSVRAETVLSRRR